MGLSPGDRLNELWLPVMNAFLRNGFSGLCPQERQFFAIFSLIGELANGGFRQYFCGSTGHLAPHAVEALTSLGAKRAAEIVSEAASEFPDGAPSEDWEQRKAVLDSLGEDALDQWQKLSELFEQESGSVLKRLEDYMERGSTGAANAG